MNYATFWKICILFVAVIAFKFDGLAQCPQDLTCNAFVNSLGVGTTSVPSGDITLHSGIKDLLLRTDGFDVDVQAINSNLFLRATQPFNLIINPDPPDGNVGIGLCCDPAAKLHVNGDFIATGTKSALVETASYGKRKLYAVESPESWFEDFGKAKLISGQAVIKLDPVFAETINTENEYHVFLTPKGDCKGLYVANQTATSFEVRELQNGRGTVAFDYRIVAKRKGYEKDRLARVEDVKQEAQVAEVINRGAEK